MSELPEKPSIRARVNQRLDEQREEGPGTGHASYPAKPSLTERTPEERRALLANAIATHVANGFRVESQVDSQAILVRGRRPNHLLHLVLSLLSFGLWLVLVWVPLAIFGGEKRRVVTVDPYGNVSSTKGRG